MKDNASWQDSSDLEMVNKWTDVHLRLPRLRFIEVASVGAEILGGRVDAELVGRVLALSAGILGDASIIFSSIASCGSVEEIDGQWRQKSSQLWNEKLAKYVEVRLAPIDPRSADVAIAIASLPPQTLAVYQGAFGDREIESLEDYSLLSIVRDQVDGRVERLWVSFPLLADYAHHCGLTVRQRAIRDKICATAGLRMTGELEDNHGTTSRISEGVLLAAHFTQGLGVSTDSLWSQWELEKNLHNAVAYLESVWDAQTDSQKIDAVFSETQSASIAYAKEGTSVADELFTFSIMRAEWLASYRGRLNESKELLADLLPAFPMRNVDIRAYTLMLEIMLEHMPDDYESSLLSLLDEQPQNGTVATVLAFAYLLDCQPENALEMLSRSEDFAWNVSRLKGLRDLTELLSLHLLGQVHEAKERGYRYLDQARHSLDKRAIISSSYALILVLLYQGQWTEAEHLIGSSLMIGRPGVITAPVYAAVSRLGASVAARTGRIGLAKSLVETARDVHNRSGALPAMWPRWDDGILLLADGSERDKTERSSRILAEIGRQCETKGYVYSALAAYVLSLGMFPESSTFVSVERIATNRGLPQREQYLHLIDAIMDDDIEMIESIIVNYVVDSRHISAVQALRAAADRARLDGKRELSAKYSMYLQKMLELSQDTPLVNVAPLVVGKPSRLSAREREIALLAGSLTNSQIAERLGITIRTVENHVTNALRKTGLRTRHELCEYARELDY